MKFGVFTDLHYDMIPDGNRRIDEFLASLRSNDAEFIIELGDLCHPSEKNKELINQLKNSNLPRYFNVGNHNTDHFILEEVLKFYNLNNNYYSFIKENIKFIVLDANYIKKQDGSELYYQKNYVKPSDSYPYIPKEQIEWLQTELQDDDKYYVIISHQSFSNDFRNRGISNRNEIRSILEHRNQKDKKVLLCINGHDHGGDYKIINGIPYYTLNSMSYFWHGTKDVFSYSAETHKNYPYLKNIILYQDPLHIIVTIDDTYNIIIKGIDGHYQKHSPSDIGLEDTWNGVSIEAKTLSVNITA